VKNEWGKKERSRAEDCSREKKKKKKGNDISAVFSLSKLLGCDIIHTAFTRMQPI